MSRSRGRSSYRSEQTMRDSVHLGATEPMCAFRAFYNGGLTSPEDRLRAVRIWIAGGGELMFSLRGVERLCVDASARLSACLAAGGGEARDEVLRVCGEVISELQRRARKDLPPPARVAVDGALWMRVVTHARRLP